MKYILLVTVASFISFGNSTAQGSLRTRSSQIKELSLSAVTTSKNDAGSIRLVKIPPNSAAAPQLRPICPYDEKKKKLVCPPKKKTLCGTSSMCGSNGLRGQDGSGG